MALWVVLWHIPTKIYSGLLPLSLSVVIISLSFFYFLSYSLFPICLLYPFVFPSMFFFRLYLFYGKCLPNTMDICLSGSLSYLSVDMFETFLPVATHFFLKLLTASLLFILLRVALRAYLVHLLIADLSVCTTPGLLYKCLNLLLVACRVLCCVVLGSFSLQSLQNSAHGKSFPKFHFIFSTNNIFLMSLLQLFTVRAWCMYVLE